MDPVAARRPFRHYPLERPVPSPEVDARRARRAAARLARPAVRGRPARPETATTRWRCTMRRIAPLLAAVAVVAVAGAVFAETCLSPYVKGLG
jgi:hypothetical protein